MTTFILAILVFIFIIPIFLQIYLCKRKNPKVGLILPIICFIVSLFSIGSMYSNYGLADDMPMQMSLSFLLNNIPTIMHLIVYWIYRKKRNSSSQKLDMNVE